MSSIPPPKSSNVASLAVTGAVGSGVVYLLEHMPPGLPPWLSWLLGGVLTVAAGAVHLYQSKPGS